MGKVYAWKIYMPDNSVKYCYMPTTVDEDGVYGYASGETPLVDTPYDISPCSAEIVRGISNAESYEKAFETMLNSVSNNCVKNSLKNYTAYYNIGCDK